MKKLQIWMFKHRALAIVISCFLLIGVYSSLLYMLKVPVWIILIFDLFLAFLSYAYVDSCQSLILKEAIKIHDESGDPYPLLKETKELMPYKKSGVNQQSLLILYCLALRNTGKYQKAFEILSSINIDKFAGTLPVNKIVYYNNLSDICELLNQYEQADIWYAKMMQLYSDMPDNKTKKKLNNLVLEAKISNQFLAGQYSEIIESLNSFEPNSLSSTIENAWLCAQAYLKLNEREKAIEKLKFIIEKGNKLYTVTKAKMLLERIENPQT